jgi:hypothetical protein
MSIARRDRRRFSQRANLEGISLHHSLAKVDAWYGQYKGQSREFLEDISVNGTKYQREAAKLVLEKLDKEVNLNTN